MIRIYPNTLTYGECHFLGMLAVYDTVCFKKRSSRQVSMETIYVIIQERH